MKAETERGKNMLAKNDNYDVVVVGAGLSGLISAYQTASKGLKTLVLEKGRHIGGSGNYVEGLCAVGTDMQKKAGINYKPDEIVKTELEYSHYEADTRSLQEYLRASADTLKWLHNEMGVEFSVVTKLGSGLVTWHLLKRQGKEQIQKHIAPSVKKAGGEIITSASAQEIIKDGNGRIHEIRIQDEGTHEQQIIKTKAVIIATGGFLNNDNLVADETRYDPKMVIPINSGKNTGDGVKLAWNIGAQKGTKATLMAFNGYLNDPDNPPYKHWYTEMTTATTFESLLMVNEQGDRFVNEQVTDNFAQCGNVLLQQNKVYTILDQGVIDYLTDEKLLKAIKVYYEDVNKPFSHLREQINKAVENKAAYITKANTIEELAQKLGLKDLPATINRYNELSKQGKDSEFGKDKQFMVPVEKGPFYAFSLGVGAFCTLGGLKTDLQNRVLKQDGNIIPGLFAVGTDAAGKLCGDTYSPNVCGTCAGYCAYSGRNAGINAVEYLNK